MTSDADKVLSFQIRDGEVVQPGLNWVYVWQAPGADGRIVRVGATWLHPAARTAKHLTEKDPGKVDVVAFAVPENIDRGRARDLLAQALEIRGRLTSNTVVGSSGASFSERLGSPATAAEAAFVDHIVARLEMTGSNVK